LDLRKICFIEPLTNSKRVEVLDSMAYPELKKDEVLGGKLDVEKLDHQLIIAVLCSNHLGHKNLKGVFDYMEYEKGERLETEFNGMKHK
jgi:hypothetical protein